MSVTYWPIAPLQWIAKGASFAGTEIVLPPQRCASLDMSAHELPTHTSNGVKGCDGGRVGAGGGKGGDGGGGSNGGGGGPGGGAGGAGSAGGALGQ